mgnify:CR=1 FL=1
MSTPVFIHVREILDVLFRRFWTIYIYIYGYMAKVLEEGVTVSFIIHPIVLVAES